MTCDCDQYTVEFERVLVTLLRGLGPWKQSVFLMPDGKNWDCAPTGTKSYGEVYIHVDISAYKAESHVCFMISDPPCQAM